MKNLLKKISDFLEKTFKNYYKSQYEFYNEVFDLRRKK